MRFMTSMHRALVALTLLGASIVHLAVAAASAAVAVALLLAVVGVGEAVGAALVLRGGLARNPALLAAALVSPVIVLSGALSIADALDRPDLVGGLAQPVLVGSAALAFSGALVAGLAARRWRVSDAPHAISARPSRPAARAALLVAAVIATGAIAAPAVAAARPEVVPGSWVSALFGKVAQGGDIVDESSTGADDPDTDTDADADDPAVEDDKPTFAVPGHGGHLGHQP